MATKACPSVLITHYDSANNADKNLRTESIRPLTAGTAGLTKSIIDGCAGVLRNSLLQAMAKRMKFKFTFCSFCFSKAFVFLDANQVDISFSLCI